MACILLGYLGTFTRQGSVVRTHYRPPIKTSTYVSPSPSVKPRTPLRRHCGGRDASEVTLARNPATMCLPLIIKVRADGDCREV